MKLKLCKLFLTFNTTIVIKTKKSQIIKKWDFYFKTIALRKNYHTLISTSTPEGNSNFINASTVLEEDE